MKYKQQNFKTLLGKNRSGGLKTKFLHEVMSSIPDGNVYALNLHSDKLSGL